MDQHSRVNIFKSFSFCTPATSGFLTVARKCELPEPEQMANLEILCTVARQVEHRDLSSSGIIIPWCRIEGRVRTGYPIGIQAKNLMHDYISSGSGAESLSPL
jgi:hypothetical protein